MPLTYHTYTHTHTKRPMTLQATTAAKYLRAFTLFASGLSTAVAEKFFF